MIDSFFSINGDFLKELDDSENIHFNETPPNMPVVEQRISPVSSVEPEFNGFPDATEMAAEAVHDVSQYVNYIKPETIVASSSSSDSGLSSDTTEM